MNREQEKEGGAGCTLHLLAIRDALEAVGGKWKIQILHYLSVNEGEQNTFKKIERGLDGISAKVLSKELKDMVDNDLISRTEISGKPVMVEYAITEYGKTTEVVSRTLIEWGTKHRQHMKNKTL